MKINRKSVLLASAVFLLIALTVTPLLTMSVLSDSLQDASVGDKYTVITINGKAITRIEGEIVTEDASVWLVCQITEKHRNEVLFKVTEGVIEVNGTAYEVIPRWWRGYYNKRTKTAWYQGYAQDEGGNKAYFGLHTIDTESTPEGCFMRMVGAFRTPEKVYWKLVVQTYRYKSA